MRNKSSILLKSVAILSTGQIIGYCLVFIRNMIVARLLSKTDFGIAAALSMTMSLLELVSQMAFGKQIVQAREGDDPNFEAVAHSVQMSVGVISALLVVAFAYPMAAAFNIPGIAWAFMALAIVPLARASIHLDLARFQRQYNFGPSVMSEIVPQVLATIAAWPLAELMGDFRAVLWIILGRETLTVLMSHLLAKRPYRWAWNPIYVKHMLVFGWPLLFNGLVMFVSQQGDQMLIGATFSMSDLGCYSIAFTLTSVPFFIFNQVGSSLMLPILAQHQDSRIQLENNYYRSLQLSALATLVVLGPIVVAGDTIVRLIYGAKYSGVGTLMTVFGIMVTIRFFRWAPAVLSMARADTINQLLANIARAVSLPIAFVLIAIGVKDMAGVAACGLIGEVVATVTALMRVKKQHEIGLAIHLKPIIFIVIWVVVGVSLQFWLKEEASIWWSVAQIILLWGFGVISSFILFPDFIDLYRKIFNNFNVPLLHGKR